VKPLRRNSRRQSEGCWIPYRIEACSCSKVRSTTSWTLFSTVRRRCRELLAEHPWQNIHETEVMTPNDSNVGLSFYPRSQKVGCDRAGCVIRKTSACIRQVRRRHYRQPIFAAGYFLARLFSTGLRRNFNREGVARIMPAQQASSVHPGLLRIRQIPTPSQLAFGQSKETLRDCF
jgi:hypothetical protein